MNIEIQTFKNQILDRNFFEKIIRDFKKDQSIVLKNVQKCPDISFNYTCKVTKYQLCGLHKVNNSEKEFKCSLVVKQCHEKDNQKEQEQFQSIFSNEIIAYQEILPRLEVEDKNLKITRPDLLYANSNVLVVNYIENYFPKNLRDPLSLQQIKSTLNEIAKLHAMSFIKSPQILSELSSKLTDCLFCSKETVFNSTFSNNLILAIEIFKTKDQSLKTKKIVALLQEYCSNFKTAHLKIVNRSDRKHKVINHGDLWTANLLFSIDDQRVALIDFQTMRFTSVAYDLSYFLYTTLIDPKLRAEHFDDLLIFYLDKLNYYILNHGVSNLVKELNIEWLRAEMKEFRSLGFLFSIWLMPLFHFDLEELQTFGSQTLETQCENIPVHYKNAMVSVILDYFKDRS